MLAEALKFCVRYAPRKHSGSRPGQVLTRPIPAQLGMSIAPNALLEGLYCEVAETCNRLNQAQVVLHGEAEAKYVFYPDLVNAKPVQQ